MPLLLRKLNYRNIFLSAERCGETVGILCRNGEYRYVTWLGFIEACEALLIPGAKPVKLKIAAYAIETSMPAKWIDLAEGEMIQGCFVGRGAYGVVSGGIPRIVNQNRG